MRASAHVALAGALAALIGLLEASTAVHVEADRAALVLIGIGVTGTMGLVFGVVQATLCGVASLAAARTGLRAPWHVLSTADDRRRAPLHDGAALGTVIACIVYASSLHVLVPRILDIDNERFAREFGVLLFAIALVGAVGIGVLTARTSLPVFARLRASGRLPWPRRTTLRRALWLGLPTVVVIVAYSRGASDAPAALAAPLTVAAFLVSELVLISIFLPVLRSTPSLTRRLPGITILCICCAMIASVVVLPRNDAVREWATRRGIVAAATRALLWLGDPDGDGYSGWLGGGDCKPFDAAVHPGSRDVPGNGADENCDGVDAAEADADSLRLYSGALPSTSPRNVVLIVMGSVRSDHTGLGEYRRETTPYLDEIARETLVFRRAYAQSSGTALSLPSLLSGREPGALEWRKAKALEPTGTTATLPHFLRELGYTTTLVAVDDPSAVPESVRGWFDHAEIVETPSDDDWFTGAAGLVTSAAIHHFEQRTNDGPPIFLALHLPDPNARYVRHGFGISRFGKGKIGLYDGEIANVDRHVGFLVQYLKYRALWEDTVVVITSDHGADLNSGKRTQSADDCHVGTTHVPLLVHVPGLEPALIDHTVGLIDIVPTILEAVGSTDIEALDGQSLLVPAVAPELAPASRAISCVSVVRRPKKPAHLRRAARNGEWIMLQDGVNDRYELYETATDPKEEHNVYPEHKGERGVQDLQGRLEQVPTSNLADLLPPG